MGFGGLISNDGPLPESRVVGVDTIGQATTVNDRTWAKPDRYLAGTLRCGDPTGGESSVYLAEHAMRKR